MTATLLEVHIRVLNVAVKRAQTLLGLVLPIEEPTKSRLNLPVYVHASSASN